VIAELVPPGVVVVETARDLPEAELVAGEEEAVANAVPARRAEFATGRACARRALVRLGREPVAVPVGPRREPLWPAGVVGSVTHCEGRRACAVADAADVVALGIDAEPHEPMPSRVTERIGRDEELTMLARLGDEEPHVCWDRLLFSAKEAVYKAWFPLTGRWLGFDQATIVVDSAARTFVARLLVPGPVVSGAALAELPGRWIVRDGVIATAVVLPAHATGGAS
jgi:4'-phosphopantetheinyl transferase EntD